MIYIVLLFTLVVSFSITSLLIKYKDKIGLNAYTNHRTIHKKTTPNSGGIAILLSFFAGLYLSGFTLGWEMIISLVLIFIIGLYDDYFSSSAKQKAFFLFLVVNILFFNDFKLEYLGTYLGHEVVVDGVSAYIFLIFALVGFINAVNLIDGIDGLASVIGIIILASYLYIGLKWDNDFLIYVPSIYIMSILGYLFFNYHPAKIFMGDNGSLTLGLIIAIVAIYAVNQHYVTPISTLMLAALPMLDTFIVMSRRIISKQSPFSADKLHIHHIILRQQKNDTRRTVLILGLLQFICSYIGLGFKIRDDILILGLFVMILILFYMFLNPKKRG
jgi:UDP-GlcNAc:undecaprenyl-phosphate GlcNAc-1-phosphate transferase